MKQYLDMVKNVLENGEETDDRTGTGTISTFGYQTRFHLPDGFPMVTTKKLHLKSIIHELLWIIKGDKNTKYLDENGVTIWDEWRMTNPMDKEDKKYVGEMYGYLWRKWPTRDFKSIDQLKDCIDTIKNAYNSRRIVMSAWNPDSLNKQALACCHILTQFKSMPMTDADKKEYTSKTGYIIDDQNKRKLSLQIYLRSNDIGLGAPFNIASYSLLLEMVAQVTGCVAWDVVYTIGDMHVYKNHIDQLKEQITREPYPLPTISINPFVKDIDQFVYSDFYLVGYTSHPRIKMDVSK